MRERKKYLMNISSARKKVKSIHFCVYITHTHTFKLPDKHLAIEMTFEIFAK